MILSDYKLWFKICIGFMFCISALIQVQANRLIYRVLGKVQEVKILLFGHYYFLLWAEVLPMEQDIINLSYSSIYVSCLSLMCCISWVERLSIWECVHVKVGRAELEHLLAVTDGILVGHNLHGTDNDDINYSTWLFYLNQVVYMI